MLYYVESFNLKPDVRSVQAVINLNHLHVLVMRQNLNHVQTLGVFQKQFPPTFSIHYS